MLFYHLGVKIPPSIRIKARVTYEVVYSDLIKDDPNCVGYCDPDTHQIILRNGLSETELAKCFIHEVLHALEFEYGLPLPHRLVYKLEAAIFKFLVLNDLI